MQDREFNAYIPDPSRGEAAILAEALAGEPPVSVRMNPCKITTHISCTEEYEVPMLSEREPELSGERHGEVISGKVEQAAVPTAVSKTAMSAGIVVVPVGIAEAEISGKVEQAAVPTTVAKTVMSAGIVETVMPAGVVEAAMSAGVAEVEISGKVEESAVPTAVVETVMSAGVAEAAIPTIIAGAEISGKVPWSRYGYYLAERPSFTFDPLFHAGQYYVQEASSMFMEHIFRSLFGKGGGLSDQESKCATDVSESGLSDQEGKCTTDVSESGLSDQESKCADAPEGLASSLWEECRGLRLLDLCAAPGGKTTLYSSLTGSGGVVVANEVIRSRAGILADNVRKWGLGNVVVTNNDPAHFASLREWFDIVAVDAPCSGEGMFRKNPEAQQEWSADSVKMCAARQRRILADAWECLRPGGVLIYSTCTFNHAENEDNIEWLADNFDCEDAGVNVPDEWNLVQTVAGGVKCFRFYPHRVTGEGFFAAAVRKTGQNSGVSGSKSIPSVVGSDDSESHTVAGKFHVAEVKSGFSTIKSSAAKDKSGFAAAKPHTAAKSRYPASKPRKSLFSDVGRSEAAELASWVMQPDAMRFARIGDNFYGYFKDTFPDIKTVSESLNAIHSGVCMGQIFGGRLKPDHSLAMFCGLKLKNKLCADSLAVCAKAAPSGSEHIAESPVCEYEFPAHCAELALPEAIRFLQREELHDISALVEGLNLITFSGAPLGWAKRVGNRTNNLYPKQLAIQSRK